MSVDKVGQSPAHVTPPAPPPPRTESPLHAVFDRVKSVVENFAHGVHDAVQRAIEKRNSDRYTHEKPRPDESKTLRDFSNAHGDSANDGVYRPGSAKPVFDDLVFHPGEDKVEVHQIHVITTPVTPKPGGPTPPKTPTGGGWI